MTKWQRDLTSRKSNSSNLEVSTTSLPGLPFFNNLIPVAANLFHHSLELYLKGSLSPGKSLAELKAIGHELLTPWNILKANHPETDFSKYDATILELNKFEELRYPDKVLKSDIVLTHKIGVDRGIILFDANSQSNYSLTLADIDLLIKTLFQLNSLQPDNHFEKDSSDILKYLQLHNKHPLIG